VPFDAEPFNYALIQYFICIKMWQFNCDGMTIPFVMNIVLQAGNKHTRLANTKVRFGISDFILQTSPSNFKRKRIQELPSPQQGLIHRREAGFFTHRVPMRPYAFDLAIDDGARLIIG